MEEDCSDEDAEVDGQSEGSLLRVMLLGGGKCEGKRNS